MITNFLPHVSLRDKIIVVNIQIVWGKMTKLLALWDTIAIKLALGKQISPYKIS